jgi:hypothetical protein
MEYKLSERINFFYKVLTLCSIFISLFLLFQYINSGEKGQHQGTQFEQKISTNPDILTRNKVGFNLEILFGLISTITYQCKDYKFLGGKGPNTEGIS